MSQTQIRLTGRPKIDRDTSGLRRITRTYIVQGSAVTEGDVEQEVFLPFGTPDIEYNETITQDLSNGGLTNSEVTGAYLIEQSIAPGQTMNEAVLTRVYQELDASNEPVQLGKDQVVRGAQDRLTVTRKFLVKNPYTDHYQENRIGVESIVVAGSTCFLGTVQSEETEVFTSFTEVYFQDGVLSESIQYKYGQYPNHKLEIRTQRSVVDVASPPATEGPGTGPWFRIDEKEGPGNQDYGQLGRTVQTVTFVKGEGLISENAEVKGKPPNTVEVTTIKYLTGENGSIPAANIPAFTRQTFEGVEEKDGYELHTIRGIVLSTDNGVVDVAVDYKHGKKPAHKLEIAKAISYGVSATSQNVMDFVYPNGDTTNLGNYVIISEKENTTGEFDVFTTTFARGLGTISDSSRKVGMTTVTETVSLHPSSPVLDPAIQVGELSRKVEQLDGYQKLTVSTTTEDSGVVELKVEERHNGALEIHTIMQLGSTWDNANTPAGFAEISVRNHRYDIYPAITKVYAKGEGVISTDTKLEGQASITTIVELFKASATVSSIIQADELSRKVEESNGYITLVVSKVTQGSKLVDWTTEERHNGALIIQTKTLLGSSWDSGFTPNGYVEISNKIHTYKIYPAITKSWAKGSGIIQTGSREDGVFSIDTFVLLGDVSQIPSNATNVVSSEESGYEKHTWEIKTPSGKEDVSLSYSSGLKTTERSRLNNTYGGDDVNAGFSTKYLDNINFLAKGFNSIKTAFKKVSESYRTGVITKSTTEIEDTPNTDFSDGGSVEQIASDLFRNTVIDVYPAEYSYFDTSVSTFYKREIEKFISNAGGKNDVSNDDNRLGGFEQIAENLYLNTKHTFEKIESVIVNKSIIFGGIQKTVTQQVVDDPDTMLASLSEWKKEPVHPEIEGSLITKTELQIKDPVVSQKVIARNPFIREVETKSVVSNKTRPPNDYGETSLITSQGANKFQSDTDSVFTNTGVELKKTSLAFGGLKKTETTTASSSDPAKLEQSVQSIHPDADEIYTYNEFEIEEEVMNESVSVSDGYLKRVSTSKISKTPSVSGFGSSRFLTKDDTNSFYLHTTDEYQVDSAVNGSVLNERKYSRLGVRFHEIESIGTPSTPNGTLVESKESSSFVPGAGGSLQPLTKYTQTGATPTPETWTTYSTQAFTIPGIILVNREGVEVIPEYTRQISVRIVHTVNTNPNNNLSGFYTPPVATVNWHVEFKDKQDPIDFNFGGSNYVYKHGTTTDLGSIDFLNGYRVEVSDYSNSGMQAASWNPNNFVLGGSTNQIYYANVGTKFAIYHHQEIIINEKPSLGV